MLGALLGEPGARGRDHLLQQNNTGANLSLRAGDWKLVRLRNRGKSQATVTLTPHQPPEGTFGLYHLPQDPGEQHDLSTQHPAELKRLQDLMERLTTDGRSRRGGGS